MCSQGHPSAPIATPPRPFAGTKAPSFELASALVVMPLVVHAFCMFTRQAAVWLQMQGAGGRLWMGSAWHYKHS
jgi:hypothetical protein